MLSVPECNPSAASSAFGRWQMLHHFSGFSRCSLVLRTVINYLSFSVRFTAETVRRFTFPLHIGPDLIRRRTEFRFTFGVIRLQLHIYSNRQTHICRLRRVAILGNENNLRAECKAEVDSADKSWFDGSNIDPVPSKKFDQVPKPRLSSCERMQRSVCTSKQHL